LQKSIFRDAGDDFTIGRVPMLIEVPEDKLLHQESGARRVPEVGKPDLIGQAAKGGDGREIKFARSRLGVKRPSYLEGVTSPFAQNCTIRPMHELLAFRPSSERGFCNANRQIWRRGDSSSEYLRLWNGLISWPFPLSVRF